MGSVSQGTSTDRDIYKLESSRRRLLSLWSIIGILLALSTVSIACHRDTSPAGEQTLSGSVEPSATTDSVSGSVDNPEGPSSYLLFNQKWVEGLSTGSLDLEDVDEVFWHVFSRLPDEVVVYPSENYYYFILHVDRRQIWGNIRLAAGRRERGVLSFAYFEYKESPFVTEPRVRKSKFFTDADGLRIEELDRFTFLVRYNGKEVTFHLHQLSQEPPKLFRLGEDEVFVMRTFDESGYQFFLLFNKRSNYLLWVLNEEELVPDQLEPLEEDLLVGRRSGFAFLVDEAHDERKVFVAVRGENATVNNYYDGPFDQLADNYVDETNISEYLQLSVPSLRGRIDKYGYYTDREGSSRVAVSPYYVYFSVSALKQFMQMCRVSWDPYFFISRKGILPTPTPGPSPTGASP